MDQGVYGAFQQGLMGLAHGGHQVVAEMDPGYFATLKQFYIDGTVQRPDGVLPRATKELIIMAVCAAMARFRGCRLHMERALRAGATFREALEALETAAIPGGLPVLWNGAEILGELMTALGPEDGAQGEGGSAPAGSGDRSDVRGGR
ncbi:MAG: carboxymuconolactone decarboxylase family protein [Deltaproteobacteria bacterium]|nr:carboxymuconolactone decarboxylase family protein [Deltaproteobacteria bacterium]